jgi:NAD(P)-dependent dehydrogenase (short-subunit alcohol dehydrogenase family)
MVTVTVITGAASEMGRQCVESLRGSADELVTVDLAAPQIDGTVGVACDISDPNAVAILVDGGMLQGLIGAFL